VDSVGEFEVAGPVCPIQAVRKPAEIIIDAIMAVNNNNFRIYVYLIKSLLRKD
jgi:hypothetical protein